MDVTKRLVELQKRYGWSDYRIAKEAGLSPNTVSNIYRRGNMPSMVTLEALCKAFGITMSQFFAEDELVELTPDLRELVARWTALNEEQKAALWQIIKTYEYALWIRAAALILFLFHTARNGDITHQIVA